MRIRTTLLPALCLLLPLAATAQSAEELAAMQKAMTPGAPHAELARQAGTWAYTVTMWAEPGADPLELIGVSTKTMIMGGRYLQEELSGEFMGQPFTGFGLNAYDNVSGEFVAIWLDNMSTGITVLHGDADASGVQTYHGEHLAPSGVPLKTRGVMQVADDDHHSYDSFVTLPDGTEFLQMRVAYTRAGA